MPVGTSPIEALYCVLNVHVPQISGKRTADSLGRGLLTINNQIIELQAAILGEYYIRGFQEDTVGSRKHSSYACSRRYFLATLGLDVTSYW